MGHTDDGGFGHPGTGSQGVLDLETVDFLPATYDHVLEPVEHLDEALLVNAPDIAGTQPAVLERGRGGLRPLPISGGDTGSAHEQLTHRARRSRYKRLAAGDDHLDAVDRTSRRPGPVEVLPADRGRDDRGGLGQ